MKERILRSEFLALRRAKPSAAAMYENEKGRLSSLNENFWAAYYAKQREKIIFEPDERAFYDFDSSPESSPQKAQTRSVRN